MFLFFESLLTSGECAVAKKQLGKAAFEFVDAMSLRYGRSVELLRGLGTR